MKFKVNIEPGRCKECGICVTMCPTKVLVVGERLNELGFRYPEPVNIDKCIGCRLCEYYCPDLVIFVERVS